jgi:hypothetical protein
MNMYIIYDHMWVLRYYDYVITFCVDTCLSGTCHLKFGRINSKPLCTHLAVQTTTRWYPSWNKLWSEALRSHTYTIRNTDEKSEWWTGTYAGLLTCTWNKSYPKTTPFHYLNHYYFTKKITPTIIGLIASFLAKLESWATKLFAVDWPHKARDGMNKQARNGGSQWLVSPQPQAG